MVLFFKDELTFKAFAAVHRLSGSHSGIGDVIFGRLSLLMSNSNLPSTNLPSLPRIAIVIWVATTSLCRSNKPCKALPLHICLYT